MKAATEKAFKSYIKEAMMTRGWVSGSNTLWDRQKTLFPDYVLTFIKSTQSDLWAQMEKLHGVGLPAMLIDALFRERDLDEVHIATCLDKEKTFLLFEQIKEKAAHDDRIIQTAMANPLDKFELGIKAIIESLMMQRMAENDSIVTCYLDDSTFQKAVFPILAKEIYTNILENQA